MCCCNVYRTSFFAIKWTHTVIFLFFTFILFLHSDLEGRFDLATWQVNSVARFYFVVCACLHAFESPVRLRCVSAWMGRTQRYTHKHTHKERERERDGGITRELGRGIDVGLTIERQHCKHWMNETGFRKYALDGLEPSSNDQRFPPRTLVFFFDRSWVKNSRPGERMSLSLSYDSATPLQFIKHPQPTRRLTLKKRLKCSAFCYHHDLSLHARNRNNRETKTFV